MLFDIQRSFDHMPCSSNASERSILLVDANPAETRILTFLLNHLTVHFDVDRWSSPVVTMALVRPTCLLP
jgi:hypothetical protein